MAGADVLVQVHIPKCAGTSVANWLRRASEEGVLSGFGSFYSDFVFDDNSLLEAGVRDPRLRALSAHNVRRYSPRIGGRRMHYFTLLRHPLRHFFSIVRYVIQERDAYGVPPNVGNSSRDIATWLVDRPAGSLFRDNTQTNHIALYPWCDMTAGRCDPAAYANWDVSDQTDYAAQRLDVAKASLRSFIAVGTVERLAASMEILRLRCAPFELQLLPVARISHDNVTRIPFDDMAWLDNEPLGKRVIEALADDWQLYAFAQQLLDEACIQYNLESKAAS